MKLYYWDDVEALADYATGYAFALANSKEEAISLISKAHEVSWCEEDTIKFIEELESTNPVVYENPTGFYIKGSA